MESLDEKLMKILEVASISGIYGPTNATTYEDLVAQIKKCFADEGYVYIPMVETVTRFERGHIPKIYMVNGKEVMTGQEWYDRFEKLVDEMGMEPPIVDGAYLECAARAAGIDNES